MLISSMIKALAAGTMAAFLAAPALGQATPTEPESDVIAMVEDQAITFGEVNTMLNSSAVVGVSIPALGTPERDTVRITLLDKMISANLIYLDALKHDLDEEPEYRTRMRRFSDAILADRYFRRYLMGDIEVSDAEIQAFYEEHVVPGTELTEEGHAQIEATLRKQKLEERKLAVRDAVRGGVEITVHESALDPNCDADRAADTPVVEIDGEVITWGEVEQRMIAAGRGATRRDPLAMESDARIGALQSVIDLRILANRARAEGVEADPVYRARVEEYGKTSLINRHRADLARRFEPSEAELEAYYEANRDRLMVPEARKVQEVVRETREQAEEIKAALEAGEMTMWEAASKHSIAPGADKNLGEIGWVNKGRPIPALDELIFTLGPEQIGGPVQSPAGWHLLRVMDVRPARYDRFDDPATRKLARRTYIHEKLDAYVVDLRKNEFDVQVYEDRLVQLSQQEADMVEQLAEKAQEPGSVTQERLEELQRFLGR